MQSVCRGKRMRTIITFPDCHIGEELDKAYLVAKKFAKFIKPTEIILQGDFMDCAAFSAWDLDKKRKMEGRRWKKEYAQGNKELDDLQKITKKITYLGGNHEDRVERYLDKNPEVEGIVEVENVLRLKERGIKFIPWTSQQMYKTGKLYWTHGYYGGKYFANKNLETFGCNIVSAHLHKPQTMFKTAKMSEAIMSWGVGCLSSREPEYLRGKPSTANNGFGITYIKPNGKFSFYPINMSKDGSFIYNGKEFKI